MSRVVTASLLGLLLTLGAAPRLAVADDEPDPSGTWTIEGGGTLTITAAPKGDRRYELAWDTPGGKYQGIGLVRGAKLVVGWGRGAAGVMILRHADDAWTGEWTTPAKADEKLGSERWAGATLEATHAFTGTNPNASTYTGSVVVEKHGEVEHVTWTAGADKSTYSGVGEKIGEERLAIGYGTGNYGVSVYDLSGGDTVEGHWAAQADKRMSVERITRQKH